MNAGNGDTAPDDIDLARLLRGAGERVQPDAAMEAEVRAAVETEWRALVAARDRRRWRTTWAAAAGVALAAVAIWIARPMLAPPSAVVATLVRAAGTVEHRPAGGAWTALGPQSTVRAGEQVRTADDGRAALALGSGIELRLDHATVFVLERADLGVLDRGGVYVDTGKSDRASGEFLVRTDAGSVRHLGTQYEARFDARGLRVAVREGSVRIDTPGGVVSAAAGEHVTVAGGEVARRALARNDVAWRWIGSIAPSFAIEGRTLEAFLGWAARETGRELVYATPAIEREAAQIVLRGSVEGLAPDEAIAAVRATTRLAIAVDGGRIEVLPPAR